MTRIIETEIGKLSYQSDPKHVGKLVNVAGIIHSDDKKKNHVTDGYHTFDELYEHRHALFIALCNNLAKEESADVWRSLNHADDTPMFEGMFIMGINTEQGDQISYHLPIEMWDYVNSHVQSVGKPPEWDGHTSEDVIKRLLGSI